MYKTLVLVTALAVLGAEEAIVKKEDGRPQSVREERIYLQGRIDQAMASRNGVIGKVDLACWPHALILISVHQSPDQAFLAWVDSIYGIIAPQEVETTEAERKRIVGKLGELKRSKADVENWSDFNVRIADAIAALNAVP